MIKTRVGVSKKGETLYCGKNLYQDLLGKFTIQDHLLMGAFHDGLSEKEKLIFSAISSSQCVADPHAWPLKVARSAARNGSFFLGISAVSSFFEQSPIGPHQIMKSAQLLIDIDHAENKPLFFEALKTQEACAGFGVFGRPQDERVVALKKWLDNNAFQPGSFFEHYQTLISVMSDRAENNTLITAALLLDMGFSLNDMEAIGFFLLLPPIFANALEAAKDQNEEMQNIPGPIVYKGVSPRLSPKAAAKAKNIENEL